MTKTQSPSIPPNASADADHQEFARQGWRHVYNVPRSATESQKVRNQIRENLGAVAIMFHTRTYRTFDGRRIPDFVSVWVRY